MAMEQKKTELKIMDDDLNIIASLSTYPNEEQGLTAETLKAKFDDAAKKIQEFINTVLVPWCNTHNDGNTGRFENISTILDNYAEKFTDISADITKLNTTLDELAALTSGMDENFGAAIEKLKNDLMGKNGIYVGAGEMPDGYYVQIDPDGEADPIIEETVLQYLKDNPPKVETDPNLEEDGTPADAAAVGNRLKPLELVTACQDDSHQAGIHNSHYRGKFLGNAVTEQQWAAIGKGTFEDMYIGDYWEIGGVRYRIAAFNYYSGDAVNDHNDAEQQDHVTIVPDFMNAEGYPMHSSNTVAYGYVNSNMSKIYLEHYLETVLAAFGKGHLMCSHQYLTSAITSEGVASQGYFWRFIDLMNEQMVFGSRINGMTIFGEYNRVATVDKSQLPLFAFRPDLIVARNLNDANGLYPQGIRYQYWLRDAGSPRGFCAVSQNGLATVYTATTTNCIVRPVFSIVASNVKTKAARSANANYEDYGLEV